jgi:hypothetical protein
MAQDPLSSLGVPATPSAASSVDPLAALGTPATVPASVSDTQPGMITRAANAVGEFGAGIVPGAIEAAGETVQALPWIGKKILSPEAMQAEREYFKPGSEAEKYGQTTGKVAEPILEFVLGDEALKGVALADKLGIASKIAKVAQDSPYIGKLLQHGVNAARMGTVGAAQAELQGATPAQAVTRGVETGVGGEAARTALEAAPAAWQAISNPFRKAVSSDPGFIERVMQGEQVAQAPAQAATRTATKAAGNEVGLSTAQPESLRLLAEEPIDIVNTLKKNLYGQVDKAAGTDLKTLYDRLDKVNDAIDLTAPGSPEEARLEATRTAQMQTIEDAKQTARTKGIDVDQTLAKADALHTREMALRDFQKGFLKNPNILEGNVAHGTPETVNIDSAIKVLQRMQDNTKFGASRLSQALGSDGAKSLLDNLYAAQRSGNKAATLQKILEWVAGATAATATGADIISHFGK